MNTIPTISAIAAVACVYLFATAPAPLPEAAERSGSRNAVIPVSKLFDTVNLVNAKTRQIWTSRIVAKGMEAGLKFEEHWLDDGEEAGPLPAVSVSIMRRELPRIGYGSVSSGDAFGYGLDLHATNVRFVASKQLLILGIAAGLGWDKYTGDAVINFRDPITGTPQPPIPVALNSSRGLAFVNAGLNLSVLKLTGEVGYQTGKDQNLSTDFEDFDTTKGKLFAGVGLRVGF